MLPVEVHVRFSVGETADSSKEAVDKIRESWAVHFLKGRGFNVTAPGLKWETPAEFEKRMNRSHSCIRRALRRPDCPHVAVHYSPNKRRILKICSNPDFDKFAVLHKSPKR